MYLRFKRKNQTIFITCEPSQHPQIPQHCTVHSAALEQSVPPSLSAHPACSLSIPPCGAWSGDKLQVVKEQLALIVGKDEDDVRLFELLSDERRLSLAVAQEKERQAKLAKAAKNPYQTAAAPAGASAASAAAALAEFVQAPLDCDRKVSEWGLQTDAIVLFVYRVGEGEEWEPMEADGVIDRKPSTRRGEEKDDHS